MTIRAFFLLLLALCAGPVWAAPILSLQPATGTHSAGSVFPVDVAIQGASDLYSFQFDVEFDPAVLTAATPVEGDFLSGGIPGTTFYVPGDTSVAGKITFTASSLIGAVGGVSGSGILATISFTAQAPGSSEITLSNVILLDSNLAEILDATLANARATVESGGSPVVPEPTTLLLLGTGLAALGYRRRRRTIS